MTANDLSMYQEVLSGTAKSESSTTTTTGLIHVTGSHVEVHRVEVEVDLAAIREAHSVCNDIFARFRRHHIIMRLAVAVAVAVVHEEVTIDLHILSTVAHVIFRLGVSLPIRIRRRIAVTVVVAAAVVLYFRQEVTIDLHTHSTVTYVISLRVHGFPNDASVQIHRRRVVVVAAAVVLHEEVTEDLLPSIVAYVTLRTIDLHIAEEVVIRLRRLEVADHLRSEIEDRRQFEVADPHRLEVEIGDPRRIIITQTFLSAE